MSKFRDLVLQGLHFVRRFFLSHLVLQGRANSKAPSKASNEWRLLFLNFRTRWIFVAQLMFQNSLHGAVNVVAGRLLRATPSRTNNSEKVDDLGRMENLNWDGCRISSLILANVSMCNSFARHPHTCGIVILPPLLNIFLALSVGVHCVTDKTKEGTE